MLKNIPALLGPEMLSVLRAMGHGDELAIVDANYPADSDAKRLVRLDGHSTPTILDAILALLPLDRDVPHAYRPCAFGDPDRIEPIYREFTAIIAQHEPGIALTPLDAAQFYPRVRQAYALVASGESRLYGNIIVRKGVIGPT